MIGTRMCLGELKIQQPLVYAMLCIDFAILQACGFECLRYIRALNLTLAASLVGKSWPKLNVLETGCVNKNL